MHVCVSRNALTTLAGIEVLVNLEWLDACCNRIQVRAELLTVRPNQHGLIQWCGPSNATFAHQLMRCSALVLAITGNLQSARHLAGCRRLRYVDLAHNLLASTQGLEGMMTQSLATRPIATY